LYVSLREILTILSKSLQARPTINGKLVIVTKELPDFASLHLAHKFQTETHLKCIKSANSWWNLLRLTQIRSCPLAKWFAVQMAFRMHPTIAAGCN